MSVHVRPSNHRVSRPFAQTTFHRIRGPPPQSLCPSAPSLLSPVRSSVHTSFGGSISALSFFFPLPSASASRCRGRCPIVAVIIQSVRDSKRMNFRPLDSPETCRPTALLSLDADVILSHSEGNILRNRHCRGYDVDITPFDTMKSSMLGGG